MAQVARGASYRSVAAKYGVSDTMLRKRQKMIDESREKEGSGKKTVLSKDEESQLASCIGSLCKLGFSPTRDQILVLVKESLNGSFAEKRSRHHRLPTPLAPNPLGSANKSFEELVLDKMKGNVDKPAVKRRKVDCTTKIITDAEYLEKLKVMKTKQKK